jgi:hypothetical protein
MRRLAFALAAGAARSSTVGRTAQRQGSAWAALWPARMLDRTATCGLGFETAGCPDLRSPTEP